MQEINVSMLFRMQKVFDQEQEHKNKLKQLQRNLSDIEKKLAIAQKNAELFRQQWSRLKTNLDDENLQLASYESNKKKFEAELYSPKNTQPKFLKEIEKKIHEISLNIDQSEEKILLLMEKTDQAHQILEDKEKELSRFQELHCQQKEILDELSHETHEALSHLELQKQMLQELMPAHYCEAFEKAYLLQNKAVAVVHPPEFCCSICKFQIPKRVIDLGIKNDKDLLFCENCGRILFFTNS